MDSIDKLFAAIDDRLPKYKEFLKNIVTMESYSIDKADVDKLGQYIGAFSEDLGYKVTVLPFE
ncbi:MAG: hypothetical protein J6R23_07085, partial [Spirochaetales bacterium]|nr:hypothetical protein [Spirochaetales bacterium]